MAQISKSDFNLAVAHLTIGAYVFAMRSCEYAKTCFEEESKRTKILRVKNIRFFLRKQLLPHSDIRIFHADMVNITFEWQKNNERDESVSMHRCKSSNVRNFDPVFVWAKIITRVRSYPGQDDVNDRKVNTVSIKNKIREISSSHIRLKLRSAVASLGEDKLGFTADEIGCHSLRSGAAMAMKLAGVSEYTIMIIGRWKSLAFLAYIRKQVAEFSFDISDNMLAYGDFFTTPNFKQASQYPISDLNNISGGKIKEETIPQRDRGKQSTPTEYTLMEDGVGSDRV